MPYLKKQKMQSSPVGPQKTKISKKQWAEIYNASWSALSIETPAQNYNQTLATTRRTRSG